MKHFGVLFRKTAETVGFSVAVQSSRTLTDYYSIATDPSYQ